MSSSSTTRNSDYCYIGIDIGGSYTHVAIFSDLGVPDFEFIDTFPTHQNYEKQLSQLIAEIQSVGLLNCAGIGISMGASLTKDGCSIQSSSNLPDYVGKPIVEDLTHWFNCRVRMAQDAVCGLLAEKRHGSIRSFDRCGYMTVSTGTCSAVQLPAGETVLTIATRGGHQILDGNPFLCSCGQRGCLQTITGGRQIQIHQGLPASEITDPSFWEFVTDKLAIGIVNLTQITRVEALALGGSIALNRACFREQVQAKVDRLLTQASLQIDCAALRENAPLIGAAILLGTAEQTIAH